MIMSKVQPVILCGGSGSRLWPLSRSGFPKQFLCLTGAHSQFQLAVKRVHDARTMLSPIVVTNEEYRFIALEQLREIQRGHSTLLLEPHGRNTAPALTLSALASRADGEDPILVVTPSDQGIRDTGAFEKCLESAIEEASNGALVILGATPTNPDTGYGYVQIQDDKCESIKSAVSHVVRRFIEKPDSKTAQQFLEQGNYFWNAGIFVLRASLWLDAIKTFRPDILEATQRAWCDRRRDNGFIRPGEAAYGLIPKDSIDYAVMEQSPGSKFSVVMVPLEAGWSDLGAWDSVWKNLPKDADGNAKTGDVIIKRSTNTLVHASNRLVAALGVENVVIIDTPDAVLVADRSLSQEVKEIVDALRKDDREECSQHRKVHRPWGWYDTITSGEGFKVKRIEVRPGSSLSLQKHHHRSEYWVVVKGDAHVTCGDVTKVLTKNESTYIPKGEIHRLANPAEIPLEVIEVQCGDYLGEDDIVRLEDSYGR